MSEYIPVVGTKCFVRNRNRKTITNIPVTITYIGNGVGCYMQHSNNQEYSYAASDYYFEPIKTADEKAIDEFAQVLNIALEADESFKDTAKKLIKAGYHNQPKVKPLSFEQYRVYESYSTFRECYRNLLKQGYIIEAKDDE